MLAVIETGILTQTLTLFLQKFSHGWANLQPAIGFLIKVFLGIEIVMFGLWMALGGIDNLVSVMKKLLYLLVWLWIVQNFPMLSNAFVKSLVMAGQMAGGGSGGNIFDPSSVLSIGLNNLTPAFSEVFKMNILKDFGNILTLVICLLLIGLAYFIIAWQIFYTVLEFYLITALVGLFLPFGFFEPTKFLAEKSIGAIVSSGIKLMVLAFLVSIIQPSLQDLSFSGKLTLDECMSILLMTGALAFLCWNAPGVAAGLMSGSPSLSAGVAMQNAMAAGGAAALAIWGASKAAGGAFNAVKAATTTAFGSSGESIGSGGSGGGVGVKAGGGAAKADGVATQQSSKVDGQAAGKTSEKTGETSGKIADQTADSAGKTVESAGETSETGAKTAKTSGDAERSTGTGSQTKKDNSSEWAMAALKAMQHVPQEAHPSGGGPQPKL